MDRIEHYCNVIKQYMNNEIKDIPSVPETPYVKGYHTRWLQFNTNIFAFDIYYDHLCNMINEGWKPYLGEEGYMIMYGFILCCKKITLNEKLVMVYEKCKYTACRNIYIIKNKLLYFYDKHDEYED